MSIHPHPLGPTNAYHPDVREAFAELFHVSTIHAYCPSPIEAGSPERADANMILFHAEYHRAYGDGAGHDALHAL